MSRDEVWVHFAAAAVTGLLSEEQRGIPIDSSARDAARYADALMAERDKRLREAKAS